MAYDEQADREAWEKQKAQARADAIQLAKDSAAKMNQQIARDNEYDVTYRSQQDIAAASKNLQQANAEAEARRKEKEAGMEAARQRLMKANEEWAKDESLYETVNINERVASKEKTTKLIEETDKDLEINAEELLRVKSEAEILQDELRAQVDKDIENFRNAASEEMKVQKAIAEKYAASVDEAVAEFQESQPLIQATKALNSNTTSSLVLRAMDVSLKEDIPILNYRRLTSDIPTRENNKDANGNIINVKFGYENVTEDEVTVLDKEWISSRFIVASNHLSEIDKINRFFSSASWKFTSTSLASSMAINPRPQFTRYADMKGTNKEDITGTPENQRIYQKYGLTKAVNLGMGRYYSEVIDDNTETIFLQFGTPRFNSLLSFFTRSISFVDQHVANTGTLPVGYYIGYALGASIRFLAFPRISIIFGAFSLFNKFSTMGEQLRYYYMKPDMHNYWSSANIVLNQICVELGLVAPFWTKTSNNMQKIGIPIEQDEASIKEWSELLGINLLGDKKSKTGDAKKDKIVNSSSKYIDLFKIAGAAQNIAAQIYNKEYEKSRDKKTTLVEKMRGYITNDNLTPGQIAAQTGNGEVNANGVFSFLNYHISLQKLIERALGSKDGGYGDQGTTKEKQLREMDKAITKDDADRSKINQAELAKKQEEQNQSNIKTAEAGGYDATARDQSEFMTWIGSLAATFDSTLRDGLGYAIFNVNYTGGMSDSVSNNVTQIPSEGLTKGFNKAARHAKFTLAGGNIVGDLQKDITDLIVNVATGVLNGVTFGLASTVTSILGGGYVTMPKMWDDSDISLASTSYTIDLVSPYGNVISQIQNIYIPLAMLIAGAFPLKTGEASYTSPYLCSLFNKGKQNIKLGMITSLTIERGTGNLAYNKNWSPLGFKVSFTVTDLDPVVTAPINAGILGEIMEIFHFQDDNFGKYIGVLCSRDLYSDIYFKPKFMRKVSRIYMAWSQALSPSYWGNKIGSFSFIYKPFSPFVAGRVTNISQQNKKLNLGD